jgi:DNA-binding protein HU-beta
MNLIPLSLTAGLRLWQCEAIRGKKWKGKGLPGGEPEEIEAMTKAELIALMAEDAGINKEIAEKVLNSVVRVIGKTLKSQGRLALAGFGTFMVKNREARVGRNPQTGSPIKIPATKVVKFKPDSQLNKTVNYHFYVHGPIGFLQIGDGAIANVTQNIDSETRKQLTNVLEEISSKLTQSDFTMPYSKEQIIELVRTGQGELKKSSPNMDKLGGLLLGLSVIIQTIANLKPFYSTLRQALSSIGILLP